MNQTLRKRYMRTCSRIISLLLVLIMLTNDFLGGGTIVLSAETSGNIETEADVDTGESTENITKNETNEENPNSKEQGDSKETGTESDSNTEEITDENSKDAEDTDEDASKETDTEENISDEVQAESASDEQADSVLEEASDFLAEDEPQTVLILEEDVSKRTSNIKYFQNEDHSYTAAIYPDPVHYEEDGEWKAIDNQLVDGEAEEGTQFLENKENLFKVKFSKKSNGSKLVKVKIDDVDISWDLEGADKVDAVPLDAGHPSTVPHLNSHSEEKVAQTTGEEAATIFTESPIAASSGITDMEEAEALYGRSYVGEEYNTSMGLLPEEQNSYPDTDDENEETLDASYYKERNEKNQEKMTVKDLSSGVLYPEIYPNVDIEYRIQSQKLKENIILKNADAQNSFVFQFKVNGLELAEKDGEIVFEDRNGETVFAIQRPFAYDADGEHTDKVSFSLKKGKGKKSELTLTVDEEWLKEEDRSFPVVIDPVVTTNQDANSIVDAYALSGHPTTNYYARNVLKTGVKGSDGAARSFIRFTLPQLKAGDMVVDASLHLLCLTNGTSAATVGAFQVMDTTWKSTDVTWRTQPIYESQPEDYLTFTPEFSKETIVNITNMVKYWYEENSNGGVMLKALKEDGQYVEYVSADYDISSMGARPFVAISYISCNGLEDYWTYHQQDAGRAGTGYVNDYNGNLVLVHQSAKTSGSRMPVALRHVYNANDKAVNFGYGYGWRLNYQQTIKAVTMLDGNRYEYVDEDGTYHYFKVDSKDNKWKDESGIDLELTINSSGTDKFVVNDKQDNKLIFDTSGKLIKITDRNQNTLSITYNSSSQITKIVDGAGREVTLSYDSTTGLLSTINDPFTDMRPLAFTYNAGKQLTKITYEDRLYSTYTYNSENELTSAQDVDGYSVRYEYTPWTYAPHRVYKVSEYAGGVKGQSYQIDRFDNTTVFTDNKGRKETYVFNKLGQTISVQNDKGYGQSSKYLTDGGNKNKLSKVSKLQSAVVNLLKNPNLESSGNWVSVQNSGTAQRIQDAAKAMEGNHAFHVTSSQAAGSAGFQQAVFLEAGKTYTLSAYVRSAEEENDTETAAWKVEKCKVQIKAVTSAGTIYSENCDRYETESGWYRLAASLTIPEGVTVSSATAYAGAEGVVTAYFDCLQLVRSAAPGRYNLIENGDFSNGTEGFVLHETNMFDKVLVNGDSDGSYVTYQRGVTTTAVNMRSGPGTEHGVVLTVNADTKITVVGGLIDSGGTLWHYTYAIKDGLVYSGFMISSFVDFTGVPAQGYSTGIVDTANLNIRQGAGTGHTILGVIPKDCRVQVLDGTESATGQHWYLVYANYANTNYLGYCLADYIYEGYAGVTLDGDSIGELDTHVFHMTGNPAKEKKITQTVNISGKKDDTFMASVWATGYAVANSDNNRKYGLEVEFVASDGSKESSISSFDARTLEWQFLNDVFIAKKDYVSVNVSLVFYYNCNAVAFDGLSLYKEDFAQSYMYDEKGNVTSVTNNAKQKSSFKYDDNDNLTNMMDPVGNNFTYEYDNAHNIKKAVSAEEMQYTFTYDTYGNPVQTRIVNKNNENQYIQSSATYSNDADDMGVPYNYSHQDSVTDALGNTTRYIYRASKGVMKSSIDPKGQTTTYHHDGTERMIGVSQVVDGETIKVDYHYDKDSLDSIGHNGFLYAFTEDGFGNNTGVSIEEKVSGDEQPESIALISRTYEINNGNLLSETYANGYIYLYTYDEFDRVVQISLREGTGTEKVLYRYAYDNEGNLAVKYDVREDLDRETIVTRYYYDLSGRLIHTSTDEEESYRYVYDANDNLTKSVQKNEHRTLETVYTYDKDSREVSVTTPKGYIYTANYDELGRVTSQAWNESIGLTNSYSYKAGVNGSQSSQVRQVNDEEYTYDANGNITSISADRKNIIYTYDELNQLVREDNSVLNQTILYAYDLGGNILEKRIYIYQPETTKEALLLLETQKIVTYGYEDAVWKDKMTSYDGQTITYDAIGNPLSYRGMTFTWKNARELGSVTKDGTTYQYRYNQDGMRNRKYLSDGTVYYQIEGDLIVGEQKIKTGETEPEYEMEFIYDSSGNVIALLYNGIEFYYEKNLQGDIVAIRNVFGELSVTYEYDSWGNVISIGGLPSDRTLGELNPFRYRGYYYDSETGFYYVSSRYYDPEVGRFISPDSTVVLEVQSNLYDKNLYAYCDNNPVMRKDETGDVWIAAVAIGVGMGAVSQYVSDVIGNISSGATGLDMFAITSSKKDYLASAIGGGIAAIPGLNLAGTAAVGALGNIVSDSIKGNIKSGKDIISSATWGAGANSIGYAASKGVAALKAKKINSMPRTQQKSYINRKLYRGSQANVNVNYHNYMSKTKSGKIGFIESKLRAFKSGIYSTITSTFAGLFRR